MGWQWQKTFNIGRAYCMFTIGQGFGLGIIYTTANLSIFVGPLIIDMTVPTPLWWSLSRQEKHSVDS